MFCKPPVNRHQKLLTAFLCGPRLMHERVTDDTSCLKCQSWESESHLYNFRGLLSPLVCNLSLGGESKIQHSRRLKLQSYSITSFLGNQSHQLFSLISLIKQLRYCVDNCEATTQACDNQTQGSQMKLQNYFFSEWFLPVIELMNMLIIICFIRNILLICLQDLYLWCSWMAFKAHLQSCPTQCR